MVIVFNLSHLSPDHVLIFNADIIPLLVKPPATDGVSEKISYISGASIFGVSATVRL